jgi:hypothetical protein
MEFLGIGVLFLLFLLGVGIGWWIISGKPAADARALQNKFVSLGNVKGKTPTQIQQVVGPPKSWAAIGENRTSCSWNTQKYHVTLIFDGDVCEGVSSEISV